MKKIKEIIVASSLLLCGACGNNWLDLEPSTYMPTDNIINELNDIDLVLNGVYSTMQNAYAYSGRFVYYADATGDDMQAAKVSNRTGSYYVMKFTKDDSPSTFWSYPYFMLNLCNLAIEQTDKIETTEEDLKNYYLGEAYALRALFHFDLTRFYGYPYQKDGGKSLGVPIVTTQLAPETQLPRNTVAECYTQVIEDLKKAIDLMDNDEGKAFQKGHINRWASMLLLSRVYLYQGDNENAYKMATEAIAGAEKAGYHLWSTEEYPTAWAADAGDAKTAGEVLFEIVNTTDDGPGNESLGYLHNTKGYYDICVTSSFYDLLTEDPNDVRIQLLKLKEDVGYFVYKYQPQSGEVIQNANIPLLRLSEAYLIAAEAAQKLGDNTNAVKYLNPIVERANPENSVEGTTVTLERIMTERRKELVAEGHRMFDALRDGGYVERIDSPKPKTPNTHLVMDAAAMKFNWDYYKCVLAIPKAEMDVNKSLEQNPEYGN